VVGGLLPPEAAGDRKKSPAVTPFFREVCARYGRIMKPLLPVWTASLLLATAAFAEEPIQLSRDLTVRHEAPSFQNNVIRIHGGALMSTKNDALKVGATVGAEVFRYTSTPGVAVGMEVSALQAGDQGGLFEGIFDTFSGKDWSGHQTSAILVLPTITLRPRDGAMRPYAAFSVGPALFRQQAKNEKTGQMREADAFRLAAFVRAGVDFVLIDRFSLVVEPVQIGRVGGEWTYGSRVSVGVNF